jgi:hypothetical protein
VFYGDVKANLYFIIGENMDTQTLLLVTPLISTGIMFLLIAITLTVRATNILLDSTTMKKSD